MFAYKIGQIQYLNAWASDDILTWAVPPNGIVSL